MEISTVYFDEPIPQVHFMKLISCSLYNSWHTLKREGSAVLGDEKKDNSVPVSKIPPGHYNLEGLAKVIDGLFDGQLIWKPFHTFQTERGLHLRAPIFSV